MKTTAKQKQKQMDSMHDIQLIRDILLDTFDDHETRAVAACVGYLEALKVMGWKIEAGYNKRDDALEVHIVQPDYWSDDEDHVCAHCSRDTL